ncbi:MAG: TPM domain-containing protein [Bacteroidota bacterium]|nr:TPM domain-containing protein [Bacteroidota bacterium]
MKIFFTLFSTFLLSTLCKISFCQSVPEFNPNHAMSDHELEQYRQSIWDSLPGAVGWVNDFGGLFKLSQTDTLESLIEHFEKETTIEIMIVTIDSNMVAKEKMAGFADRLLKIWGIGKRAKKNGIVICICSGYKQIEMSTDAGIEIIMDDVRKMQLLKKYFIPDYQRNRYYHGTFIGLTALIKVLTP